MNRHECTWLEFRGICGFYTAPGDDRAYMCADICRHGDCPFGCLIGSNCSPRGNPPKTPYTAFALAGKQSITTDIQTPHTRTAAHWARIYERAPHTPTKGLLEP